MISIQRSITPAILAKQGNTVRYNRKTVVKKLWIMQNKKCCYCENFIPEKGHSKAVEHFKPKGKFEDLINVWDNLLLACSQCNGKKSDDFAVLLTDNENEVKVVFIDKPSTAESAILDPSDLTYDPEDHIGFKIDRSIPLEWGLSFGRENSLKGKTTIQVIGLDTSYYRKRHQAVLNLFESEYNTMLNALNAEDHDMVNSKKDAFKLFMSSKSQLSALAREFVRFRKIDVYFELDIPVGFV